MKHTLKQLISDYCIFSHYRAGILYYNLFVLGDEVGKYYLLPIEISDQKEIGNATFENKIKSITLMRYIRKAIDEGTLRSI